VEAFRAEGLKIGFYYSLLIGIIPSILLIRIIPKGPERQEEEEYDRLNKGRDMAIYREYVKIR
jgi:alpha-L-fucosidase